MATENLEMQELFAAADIPWMTLAPEQQFGAYTTQRFRPGPSPVRTAFEEFEYPLMQQYYLAQPRMPEYGSFTDYMTQLGMPEYSPYGTFGLEGRAQQAAAIAGLTPEQFFEYVDPQVDYTGTPISQGVRTQIGELSPAEQLIYRQTYGTGTAAAANQAQLANLLALQRTGGGMYGGVMGEAITRGLGELQQQLAFRSPETNFLDWYLARRDQPGVAGGFLTAPTTSPTYPVDYIGGGEAPLPGAVTGRPATLGTQITPNIIPGSGGLLGLNVQTTPRVRPELLYDYLGQDIPVPGSTQYGIQPTPSVPPIYPVDYYGETPLPGRTQYGIQPTPSVPPIYPVDYIGGGEAPLPGRTQYGNFVDYFNSGLSGQ